MALGDRKSSDIFNKNTGGSKDAKSIDTSKETEIKNKFDRGEHIEDAGMFENLAPVLYAIQQLTEDIEELRRYITAEVGDGAQGPQGPAGPKGDKGDIGATGAAGARGADGTTPTITDLDGSSLPTRSGSRGTLWNDRGIVKVS
jgi:hypothetical protein